MLLGLVATCRDIRKTSIAPFRQFRLWDGKSHVERLKCTRERPKSNDEK